MRIDQSRILQQENESIPYINHMGAFSSNYTSIIYVYVLSRVVQGFSNQIPKGVSLYSKLVSYPQFTHLRVYSTLSLHGIPYQIFIPQVYWLN